MNTRLLKILLKGLITAIILGRCFGEEKNLSLPAVDVGIGAFIETEQEKIKPTYGTPYKAYGVWFSGLRVHANTQGMQGSKVKVFFLGNTQIEGYVGKLESQCTIKHLIESSRGIAHFVNVQSDHSLAVKARVTKVLFHHKGMKIKIRGEGMYGIGGISRSANTAYPKGRSDCAPLHILKAKQKIDGQWADYEGCEVLKECLSLPETMLTLKRVKGDLLLENEITDTITASIGIYTRWGIWRIGREDIFFNIGRDYCFKDTLGTAFNIRYNICANTHVAVEAHLGKARNITLSFQYTLG